MVEPEGQSLRILKQESNGSWIVSWMSGSAILASERVVCRSVVTSHGETSQAPLVVEPSGSTLRLELPMRLVRKAGFSGAVVKVIVSGLGGFHSNFLPREVV